MLPDYRNDPIAYEIEERSRPDEMMMLEEAGRMSNLILANHSHREAYALDLCCGTGLSMQGLVNHPAVESVVGIDICRPYLSFTRKAYLGCRARLHLIQADAVMLPLKARNWDLIMLASAYHHIENERKLEFLANVRVLLGPEGRAVMAENVLPPYRERNEAQYKNSVRLFYEEVLRTVRSLNPSVSGHVQNLIWRVAQYGFDGEYEYKVSMDVLKRHLAQAGLSIVEQVQVWPHESSSLGKSGGNFVFMLKADQEGFNVEVD